MTTTPVPPSPWRIAVGPDPERAASTELLETPDLDRLTKALADPDTELVLYRVTYDRVGRRGGRDNSAPPPALTTWALGADDLAGLVHLNVRQYLLSRDVWVDVDLSTGRGYISCGFNNGGSFTVACLARAVADPTGPQPAP